MGSGYFGCQGNSRVGDDQRILRGLKVRFQEFCGKENLEGILLGGFI